MFAPWSLIWTAARWQPAWLIRVLQPAWKIVEWQSIQQEKWPLSVGLQGGLGPAQ
jgi:hypothetical protein